ncbi:hypothetical protein HHI36_009814 [Cryptolaemus montrouzieri]|uniref:Uncharacterized protein n=1 Tax=Cryptolaemus montrouzieri TaxID=559131 RepID=A0ABD2MGW9_9CUCU
MLIKRPQSQIPFKKWFKRGAVTIFVLEAVGFVFTYNVWSKINTDRDSRKYLKDNFPSVLEAYYKVGEYINPNSNVRHIDYAYWASICSGTGFGLYVGLSPSEERINKIRKEISGADGGKSAAEIRSKNQKFLDILQSAAQTNKPVHLMTREELKNLNRD